MTTLYCAVCLYTRDGEAPEAVTIIEGYAVCDEHMGYLAKGDRFAAIRHAARLDPQGDQLGNDGASDG